MQTEYKQLYFAIRHKDAQLNYALISVSWVHRAIWLASDKNFGYKPALASHQPAISLVAAGTWHKQRMYTSPCRCWLNA